MADEPKKSETAKREEEILAFWNENAIFETSLKKPAPKGEFVFYDGPPFATGLPHHGHLLGSTSKDLFGRYKTMRGYHVRRRWGWDTHGLPIESKVEEKLGFKTKKDILDIGVAQFNETARSMVLEYVREWKRYIERLGRWVDFDNSYKTMDNTFIESVWWAIKEVYKKGQLYEGRKVLMYCPHCETPLAKAEIAMDNTYKDVTEEAVTVKFRLSNPEQVGEKQPTFMLAWTTTPWTLPGNVALAVGPDIDYIKVRHESETLIVARERAEALGLSAEGADSIRGNLLVGQLYEPLYTIKGATAHEGKKWQVVSADFVTTEEGTGVVHTAVMYGEDDYLLGQKEGLPMVQLLNADGSYNAEAPEFVQGVYIKDAERDIKKDLEGQNLLFARENHTHSYPHCHRCGTPLIYNAVSSWFIDIQKVKLRMLAENEKVNWYPTHLKHGRFKHIVEGAPDWTISRNRFWASPLPIWKDKDGNLTVIGSLDELKERTKKSGNRYFLMRHGQAESNAKDIASTTPTAKNHLTELGRRQAGESAEKLKAENIDLIITTPILRARETADIVAETIGYAKENIIVDERMREIDIGVLEGKSNSDFHDFFEHSYEVMFKKRPENGEHLADMRQRVGEFLYELEEQHKGKTILIVAHEYPIWLAEAIARGADEKQTIAIKLERPEYYETGEVKLFNFVPIPHNARYELDFHLPYIDAVEVVGENGESLTRTPEVVDSWVEAASMPFAEYHYPFENVREFEKRSPGDFISEYIAQTRTWFYYLHALSISLFDHRAFTNVVTTGTILAADGAKMSKSKNNFTDPLISIEQFGADALRFYLMSSVVMQAEDFNFKDEDLRDAHNKVVNLLRNTLTFYQLYQDDAPAPADTSGDTLDRWILARLNETVRQSSEALDRFDTVRATRPLREFIDDFSTWYVRRSRERVKAGGEDAARALGTMRHVLRECAKVIAPIMPFIADEVFRAVRVSSDEESVHLTSWPTPRRPFFGIFGGVLKKDETLLKEMAQTRSVISGALKARQLSGIKVRQPLLSVTLKDETLKGRTEFLELIKDEVNVKEVLFNPSLEEDVALNTAITPQLKEEGQVRELIRSIQELRKKTALSPKDKATLVFAEDTTLLEKHWDDISRATNVVRFEKGETTHVSAA